jgi:hypothetical protein
MENSHELQMQLFHKIREMLPPASSLSDEVAEVLNISNDSAYRRIRGEKPLVIDEIFALCQRFNLSIDEIFKTKTKGDSFLCRIIETKDISFEDYLKTMYNNLLQIQMLRNPEIIYSAKDIPIFHHFLFPKLAAFKIFFWSKTVWQLPEFKDKKFSFNEVSDSTMEIGRKVLNLYSKLPSVEIWNEETASSAMRQIEYYLTCGIIENKKDALQLCDDFSALFDHLKQEAELGSKFLPGCEPVYTNNFKLYHNEVILGDNSISVTSDTIKMTFITFNVLNLMVSSEPGFCNKVESYLRTMMKKSSLISEDSEKERNRFFNLIQIRLSSTRDRIVNF